MTKPSVGFPALPESHRHFLENALSRLREDSRIVAVAAGGSFLSDTVDEYSDLDLVIVIEPSALESLMPQRQQFAERLGLLLAAFTGEHVGEPRLLICLYDDPLLHVDLKFVSLSDASDRVEDPFILWERDGRLTEVLQERAAVFPEPKPQWIEDRFWVWVYYIGGRIGRGELFEAHDSLGLLRMWVLGPMALQAQGARPAGVRRIEKYAPQYAKAMKATVGRYDGVSCVKALYASVELYRTLREQLANRDLERRTGAEQAVTKYLEQIKARIE
jgi:predicted nucleotidyltransferase